MQKIVNVLAIASSVVSLAVVGGGVYLYTQKDAIIEDIKEKAMESVLGGGLGGAVSGAVGSGGLPISEPSLDAPTEPALPINPF